MAAGHTRVRADVAKVPLGPMVGKVTGLIASPPCQDFSLAGKQAGITGEKGQLIAEVLRWTDALRPEWVACEQVPPCLPIWQEYAEVMRGWGYRTWVGVLNAADYGVSLRPGNGRSCWPAVSGSRNAPNRPTPKGDRSTCSVNAHRTSSPRFSTLPYQPRRRLPHDRLRPHRPSAPCGCR